MNVNIILIFFLMNQLCKPDESIRQVCGMDSAGLRNGFRRFAEWVKSGKMRLVLG